MKIVEGIKKEEKMQIMKDFNELKPLCTFGGFQPFLFDAVADLSLGLALRKVTFNHSRVAFINFNLLLVIRFEVSQL